MQYIGQYRLTVLTLLIYNGKIMLSNMKVMMFMKNELRKIYKEKRKLMSRAEAEEKSVLACNRFLESEMYKNARTIMLYLPLGNEADTNLIIKSAFADGKKVALPVTEQESGAITPYFVNENTEFAKGAFSVTEPLNSQAADISEIDVVIVPGIAFDKNGNRIGFGKGCYDKFLNKFDCIKVGFCYDYQICDEIPSDKYDVKMDCIITEKRVILKKY